MRLSLLGCFLIFCLAGCRGESLLPPTPTPEDAPPTALSTPEVVTPTPPGPESPTTGTAWRYRKPRTTETPALIEREDGFALDPAWRIARAEYVYQWWGLAPDAALESQVLIRDGAQYRRDDTIIPDEPVENFVRSISRFHPTQAYVYGNAWTDDYPTHTVEVTGEDGQRLLFISTSTGNRGDGPWNLVYNDRIYAQYDGALGYGLEGIFDYQMRGTVAEKFGDQGREEEVTFATYGLPRQLEYGFDGLLPVSEVFTYHADIAEGTIEGSLVGRRSVAGTGSMVIGTFTELTGMRLRTGDGDAECAIVTTELNDVVGAAWEFSCQLGAHGEGEAFVYPVSFDLIDDRGEAVTLSGTLSGAWSSAPVPLRYPLPAFLRSAFEQSRDAIEVVSGYEHAIAGYYAVLEPEPPNAVKRLWGDVTLYGSTEFEGRPVRYQVTTPFAISDTQTLIWHTTRADLDALVVDTLALTETVTVLGRYTDTMLQLGYFVPMERDFRFLDTYQGAFPLAYAATCPADTGESETQPQATRAVGYRFRGEESRVFGGIDPEGDFRISYARLQLRPDGPTLRFPGSETPLTEGHVTLSRVKTRDSFTFGLDPEDVTPEKIALFEALAESIGAELNYRNSTPEQHPEWWVDRPFVITMTESGNFEMLHCDP